MSASSKIFGTAKHIRQKPAYSLGQNIFDEADIMIPPFHFYVMAIIVNYYISPTFFHTMFPLF